jgi:hypothetical protein
MSEWQIRIAHRSRDDSILDVADASRHLQGEDRQIARQLVLDAVIDGLSTAGELLDRLETADPASRRALLDRVRQDVGLRTTGEVEDQRRYDAASLAGRMRARANSPYQLCHAPDCNAAPRDELTGAPAITDARKWWCPAHLDQAGPGDMEPRGSGIRISESGALVPVDEAAEEAEQAREESRRRQLEERLAERQPDVEAPRERDQARREQYERELPDELFPV